jgi:hypothetical protein
MVGVASFWIADPSILVASNLATKAKVEPHNRERDRNRKKTEDVRTMRCQRRNARGSPTEALLKSDDRLTLKEKG